MRRPDTGQYIAASATVLSAVVILLLLFGIHLHYAAPPSPTPKEAITLAELSEPIPEEDMFIEPIIEDAGNPEITADDQQAPTPQGEPEPAPTPNDRLVVTGPNPKPNPETTPLTATPQPSPVKTTAPSQKDEQEQRVKADVKNKFKTQNGSPDGKSRQTASSGTADSGTGATGKTQDGKRGLKSYTKPKDFTISKTIKVYVTLMVKADGTVKKGSARCSELGNYPSLKKKVLDCSESSIWDKASDKNARDASATIVWTLVPGTK